MMQREHSDEATQSVSGASVNEAIRRIASPEMLLSVDLLPHLICSRPVFIGGCRNGAGQHGDA